MAGLERLSLPLLALVRVISVKFSGLHWLLQISAVWAFGRLYSLGVMLTVAHQQGVSPWAPASPTYLDYINGWDAGYYEQIYDFGYPSILPRDPQGTVTNNPWAFMPLYPLIVRGVSSLTGLGWREAAPTVSLIASLALILILYRLFLTKVGHGTAITAAALFSFGPASPILQFPYAEALGLTLVATTLLLIVRERYLLAIPFVLLAALARPVAAPMAVTCVIVASVLVWTSHKAGTELGVRPRLSLVALVGTSVAAVAMWPLIAWWSTGEPRAYFLTEESWHAGNGTFPGLLWAKTFVKYFGMWPGVAVGAVVTVVIAWFMFSGASLRVGLVMWAWTGSVVGYLMCVHRIATESPRLLMSALPLALMLVGASRSRAFRIFLIVLALATQLLWAGWIWHWEAADITAVEPPP